MGLIETIQVEDWRSAVEQWRKLSRGWVFRGQRCASWGLQTSLERSGSLTPVEDERRTLDLFCRRAGVHLPSHLKPVEPVSWLALMQHYGAPTRLLDFTFSPYVAAFFAFRDGPTQAEPRAVWALAVHACRSLAASQLPRIVGQDGRTNERMLIECQNLVMAHAIGSDERFSGVFPVEPWIFDQRQSAQQTVLLSPGRVDRTFQENLDALGECDGLIRKYVLPDSLRGVILEDLERMNVTAASLFPGLEGLAMSMHSHLTIEPPGQVNLRRAIAGAPTYPGVPVSGPDELNPPL